MIDSAICGFSLSLVIESNALLYYFFHELLLHFEIFSMSATSQLPNIIICGTPGVGKTRLCESLCSANKSLTYLNINELAKQHKFLLEYDEENECQILDDDAVHDYLEDEYFAKTPSPSGLVIDYHSAGIVPENDSIHGIFVVRCSNDKLYDRFKERNYSAKKIEQNIQSEIFQICLDEARETFDENLVHEITNETEEDFQKNVENLRNWINQWSVDNHKSEKKKKKKKS